MERQVLIVFLRHTENINITCHLKTYRYKKKATEKSDFLNTITNILGLSVKQRDVLYDDGYDMISTIIHWKYDKIRDWFTTKSKLTTTRGGDSYVGRQINFLQVSAWWATNLNLRVNRLSYMTLMTL